MNDKINLQELIDILAQTNGMKQADACIFVKTFWNTIEEALMNDKNVKIKGLGTFKLVDVESRESVNVQTGERFEIEHHTKVSFLPDASMRNIINKPFSHFESVILHEGTHFNDMTEDDVCASMAEQQVESDNPDLDNKEYIKNHEEKNSEPVGEVSVSAVEYDAGRHDMQEGESTEEQEAHEAQRGEEDKVDESLSEVVAQEKVVSEVVVQEIEVIGTDVQEVAALQVDTASDDKKEPVAEDKIQETEDCNTSAQHVVAVPREEKLQVEAMQTEVDEIKENQAETAEVADGRLELPRNTVEESTQSVDVSTEEPDLKEASVILVHSDAQEKQTKRKSAHVKIYWGVALLLIGIVIGNVLSWLFWADIQTEKLEEYENSVAENTVVKSDITDTVDQQHEEVLIPEKEVVVEMVSKKELQQQHKKQELPVNTAKMDQNRTQKIGVAESKKAKNVPVKKESLADTVEYEMAETLSTDTIKHGDTLAKIAYKFYGNRKLWPYIVIFNKTLIKDPDNVPIGTVIQIPKLVEKH